MSTAYRVMMYIDGTEVPSSCVFTGTLAKCAACAARLTRSAHQSVQWRAVPCCA